MPKLPIFFFEQDISFKLKDKNKIRFWLNDTINSENKILNSVNIIFCSDEYLHQINVQYLNHDTFTDIITFDQSDSNDIILGDIFISVNRVKENAKLYKTTFSNELKRVMIHGVLHLIGYKDKSKAAKKTMTEKEDYYLNLYKS